MQGDTIKLSGHSPSSPRFKGVGVRSPRTLRNLDDPTQPLSQASHGTSLPGLPPHATSSSRRVRSRRLEPSPCCAQARIAPLRTNARTALLAGGLPSLLVHDGAT